MSYHTDIHTSIEKKTQPAERGSLVTKLFLACGILGPVLYVIEFLIEGAIRPQYNPWRQWISHLSLGEQGWINSLGLILCGVLVLCFAVGLRLALRTGRGSLWGPLLVACFGVGLIIAGIFVIDPGYGYPPGVPANYSLHGMIHNIVGTLGVFVAAIVLCFVIANHFARDPLTKNWARYSRWTAVVTLLSFLVCSTLATLDQVNVLPGAPSGLFERVAFIAISLWMALLALHFIRQHQTR